MTMLDSKPKKKQNQKHSKWRAKEKGGGEDPAGLPKLPKFEQTQIFVGGCHPETTEADIRGYFSEYGKITEMQMMVDKITSKCRGNPFYSLKIEIFALKNDLIVVFGILFLAVFFASQKLRDSSNLL